MTPDFIQIRCRGYRMIHGFDAENREIEERVGGGEWVDKIIAVSRIQSITERYIRMSYSHERIIYWEYEGGLEAIARKLRLSD